MTVDTSSNARLTQDERIIAALAHASVLLPFWGMIAAVVIWVTQKDKSAFANFLAIPFAASTGPSDAPPSPLFFVGFFLPFAVMGVVLLAWFMMIVYGLAAAVMTLQGKDFRYVLIGRRLESYLRQK